MHPVPLGAATRGYPGTGYPVENIHSGPIAVVDAAGRLLYSSGDPDAMVFTRLALKPFQALPFVLADGPARFGLTPRREPPPWCRMHGAALQGYIDPRHPLQQAIHAARRPARSAPCSPCSLKIRGSEALRKS
jgi:L-asparaginase II